MKARCTDCNSRLKTSYEDYRFPGVEVCPKCVDGRRGGNDDLFWWGSEYVRDAPAVLPILLGTYVICASIIAIILLLLR